MNEEWEDVIGFYGLYQISNKGFLLSLSKFRNTGTGGYWSKEKLLSPKIDRKGYRFFELTKNGKKFNFKRGRLVAIHFIDNPLELPEVNHLDGVKWNDIFSNLEWSTSSDNQKHAYRTGLKKAAYLGKFGKDHNQSKSVIAIQDIAILEFNSKTECAKYLGVSVQSVSQAMKFNFICKGHTIC